MCPIKITIDYDDTFKNAASALIKNARFAESHEQFSELLSHVQITAELIKIGLTTDTGLKHNEDSQLINQLTTESITPPITGYTTPKPLKKPSLKATRPFNKAAERLIASANITKSMNGYNNLLNTVKITAALLASAGQYNAPQTGDTVINTLIKEKLERPATLQSGL